MFNNILVMTLLLYLMFLMLNLVLMENHKILDLNKFNIYECGYDLVYWSQFKLNLHFFKIGLIFIMFDLEIMFLIIMVNNYNLIFTSWLIIQFIMYTLYLEMYFCSLFWNI